MAAPPRVNMTDAEATAEAELREWASGQKVTMKTVDLLAKEGFNSMEALALLDGEDLAQTKIARGQQKLLLSAIRPLQHKTTQSNMAAETAATGGDGTARSTAADGQTTESEGRPNEGRDGQAIAAGIPTTGADGQASTAGGLAARANGLPTGANGHPNDIYARLMADHMEKLQGNATAGVAVEQGTWPHGTRTAQFAGHVQTATVGQSGTLPGSWQDPQIHLMTAAAGRSCHYYDVDFIVRDVVEEEVVAGTNDGHHIVVKSGVKPKIESITLSQWYIANLAILYKLLGEGKLRDQGIIDYLSYTTKLYQLTQRYENVSVYLYDREYRKLQSVHGFRWGTDIPHLHTMQLNPRAPRNHARPPGPGFAHAKPAQRGIPTGPVTADGRAICKMYNTYHGCGYTDCKYVHSCSYRGCSQTHPATAHSQSQTYVHPR